MKKIESMEALIKPDKYQVFLFSCPAAMPFFFARHPWFIVNQEGIISRWEIFRNPEEWDMRWGHLHKNFYSPLQGIPKFSFSRKYFWGQGKLLGCVEGDENSVAKEMAEFIVNSPKTYPHCDKYLLKGPNSNTYAQWVLDKFPGSNLHLPWNHFGKRG